MEAVRLDQIVDDVEAVVTRRDRGINTVATAGDAIGLADFGEHGLRLRCSAAKRIENTALALENGGWAGETFLGEKGGLDAAARTQRTVDALDLTAGLVVFEDAA